MKFKPLSNNKNAFVILFAVLLVSIILAISLSLFSITFKQLVLSLVARDSQVAYFAADSALNCAKNLYRNQDEEVQRIFGYIVPADPGPPGSPAHFEPDVVPVEQITCGLDSQVGTVTVDDEDPPGAVSRIRKISFPVFYDGSPDGSNGGPCAKITVEITVGMLLSEIQSTSIEARGFNLSSAGQCPAADNNRVVERAQKVYISG